MALGADTLTTPPNLETDTMKQTVRHGHETAAYGGDGKRTYPSIKALAQALAMPYSTVYYRLRTGRSVAGYAVDYERRRT